MSDGEVDNDVFDLESWPFYWVVRASSTYLKVLEKELKGGDLDVPSWRVLMLLGENSARSVSYLADKSVIKRSTMTRIVYRMRDAELVTVRTRESDARVTEVLLTKKGQYSRKVAWMHGQTVLKSALGGISAEERKMTVETLSKLIRNLENFDLPVFQP